MAEEFNEFSVGYNGPGTGAGEWLIAPENCNGIRLKGGHTLDVSRHVPSTVAATAANGTIIGSGGVWTVYTAAGAAGVKLLLENRCATDEFATARLRARAANTTVAGNGGNSVGTTTCVDASASANAAEYGNLKAVNAVAQPNAYAQTADSSNIVCALYGRIDATAGSVGPALGLVDRHSRDDEGRSRGLHGPHLAQRDGGDQRRLHDLQRRAT
ncbi:MAG: hypothetical protein IPQ07_41220, partial [Myxococcales bacterium]|nr:hypothetical protein [Myxococcales bacterium]